MMKLHILIVLALFTGCAAIRSQNCSENAGYEKGYNDAKMGRIKSLSQFSMICGEKESEVAQKGYQRGFEEGGKNSTPTMNLTLKGGKLGVVSAYKCQINYQGQTFTKEAVTEPAARNMVLDECNKKIKGCFTMESSVSCYKN